MNNRQAYNNWAGIYDTAENKTRDIEAKVMKKVLAEYKFSNVLEIGCGTGKNTKWLASRAEHVKCVDFSDEMLKIAKKKIKSPNVSFIKHNIKREWKITKPKYDLVTCSLVLEHIQNIDYIFGQAFRVLKKDGIFYIGELHPLKQYDGSKARFKKSGKTVVLDCYVHNISDFTRSALKNSFKIIEIKDWYDEDKKLSMPRLLTMVFIRNLK